MTDSWHRHGTGSDSPDYMQNRRMHVYSGARFIEIDKRQHHMDKKYT